MPSPIRSSDDIINMCGFRGGMVYHPLSMLFVVLELSQYCIYGLIPFTVSNNFPHMLLLIIH